MVSILSPQVMGFLEGVSGLSLQETTNLANLLNKQDEAGKYVQIGEALLISERGSPLVHEISVALATAQSIHVYLNQKISELAFLPGEVASPLARAISPVAVASTVTPVAAVASRAIGPITPAGTVGVMLPIVRTGDAGLISTSSLQGEFNEFMKLSLALLGPKALSMDNLSSFLTYFGNNGHWEEGIPEFLKLTPREIDLALTVLNMENRNLNTLAHYTIPFILELETDREKIEGFNRLMGVDLPFNPPETSISEIKRMGEILRLIDGKITAKPAEISRPAGLASAAPELAPRFNTDQNEYERRFDQTVNSALGLIQDSKGFRECLDFIAYERNQMAPKDERGDFGVLRCEYEDIAYTPFGGYQKYLDLFLQGEKTGWEKELIRSRDGVVQVIYTMGITPDGSADPLTLTTIQLDPNNLKDPDLQGARTVGWNHTVPENIERGLAQAKLLFDSVVSFPHPIDENGLKILMEKVGELHWWLAHTMPYHRGSAAIAKMMIGAILKYHGVQPGGFGKIEPDCIALTHNLEEFKASYLHLMQSPPPCLVRA
ncbi:MAG: hypothetical protein NTX49_06440 [Chlamydiae bacterium]|nr:hypothetical protein [Chlamydiota bacterium]